MTSFERFGPAQKRLVAASVLALALIALVIILAPRPVAGAGEPAIEFRVMAKRHIQEASEADQKEYLRDILRACRAHGVQRYVIRSSGMSILLGGEPDLVKLARWVELAREVQGEAAWQ